MGFWKRERGGSNAAFASFHLLFLDFGVLDHVNAVARRDFAFDRDCLGGVSRQLVVERLVLANEQIGLAVVGFDSDW